MLTKESRVRIAAAIITAIVLLLVALVLILDRFPELQQSRWVVALGIFASITSPIAVYEFFIKRLISQDEINSKSGQTEIINGQALEIKGNQQGTVTQHDQRGQTVQGPQTNIGNIHGHQFSGSIGTVNLSASSKTPPLSSPWQIPMPPKDFTGRSKDIDDILADFERGATITGLRGMGGIGKTALALVLAQRLKDRFPDGQLFIDLKGTSEKPLAASDAMAQVVRAHLGSDIKTPENETELAGLYRSVLEGKRTLLLLDNAASREQVLPLLPPEYCSVLVTSRKKFALSGLKPWDLDPLSPEDARKLLITIYPQIGDNADRLAELCGYLPITLKAAAYLLVETPDLAPAKYIEELGDERSRLKQLGRSGEDLDVEACFNLSYSRLSADSARVFRLLSVFPGDFDAKAEEVICQDEGHSILSELVRWSLVEYQRSETGDEGRYHLHDLVRLFASEWLEEADGKAAITRARGAHAKHFKDVLSYATKLYKNGEVLAGLNAFDLERRNIYSAWTWAKENLETNNEAASICSSFLNWPLLLELRQHPRERISWLETALSAARLTNDEIMEGIHLGNLGNAHALLGEFRQAIEYYQQALVIAQEIGDLRSEGAALGNLGNAHASLGEAHQAIEYHQQALAIAKEVGDQRGEGNRLGNLGLVYASLGEAHQAIEFYEKALAISREIGDLRSEGAVLGNLGNAHASLGEAHQAIEYHQQALAIARDIGDRRGEGNALWNMSLALDKLDNRARAIDCARAALKILEEIEDPHAEKVKRQLREWESS